jgi:toxin ParE1/3/4
MAALQLSPKARSDLVSVGEYTRLNWGEAQTIRYLDKIQDCMDRLAENPMLGRACDEILPGRRRMEEGRHVIFYRIEKKKIVISRILHRSMVPQGKVQ